VHGRIYRILNVIGQGGEATVYRCEDQSGSQHAVKVFYFSRYPRFQIPSRVDNFNREGHILKYLSGRSRYFIYLEDYEYRPRENIGYMIMELGDTCLRKHLLGQPLNDELRRFYWKQIVAILRALVDAQIGKSIEVNIIQPLIFHSIIHPLKYMRISSLII
jgi:serine/threonine protein kinase